MLREEKRIFGTLPKPTYEDYGQAPMKVAHRERASSPTRKSQPPPPKSFKPVVKLPEKKTLSKNSYNPTYSEYGQSPLKPRAQKALTAKEEELKRIISQIASLQSRRELLERELADAREMKSAVVAG